MKFRLFTLLPGIFESFVGSGLIGKANSNGLINIETINFRDKYGKGNYKQIDDSPFGGGSGMVIMPEPITLAMEEYGILESRKSCYENKDGFLEVNLLNNYKENLAKANNYQFSQSPTKQLIPNSVLPNNSRFFELITSGKLTTKHINISLTPRGFGLNQQVAEWIAGNFQEVNILCGRYEGFDQRVAESVDLELSIGNFVLNGGEVAGMCLIEAISRLVPSVIVKGSSVLHDSFSSGLNNYEEFAFGNGNKKYQDQFQMSKPESSLKNLFDNISYIKNILPFIEHPQYTRPDIWRNKKVPEVLLGGNHSDIQKWRKKWY